MIAVAMPRMNSMPSLLCHTTPAFITGLHMTHRGKKGLEVALASSTAAFTHTHEFHAIPAVQHNAGFHHRAAHGVTGKKESSRQHQTPE
jgi:hypothetical protein